MGPIIDPALRTSSARCPGSRRACGAAWWNGALHILGGFGVRGSVAPDDVGADLWCYENGWRAHYCSARREDFSEPPWAGAASRPLGQSANLERSLRATNDGNGDTCVWMVCGDGGVDVGFNLCWMN